MAKHEFEFEVYPSGDCLCITIASGYDPDVTYCINHHPNWWVHLLIDESLGYTIDVQVGNHNAVLLDASQDGGRGVDEDELEVTAKGRYRIKLLTRALGYVKEHETRIIYAMERLYQERRGVPGDVAIGRILKDW